MLPNCLRCRKRANLMTMPIECIWLPIPHHASEPSIRTLHSKLIPFLFLAPLTFACSSNPNEACERSRACEYEGRCVAFGGHCVAVEDSDCERSINCMAKGKCTSVGDRCLAKTTKDCTEKSDVCRTAGRCSIRGGECAATNTADCLKAETKLQNPLRKNEVVNLCKGIGL